MALGSLKTVWPWDQAPKGWVGPVKRGDVVRVVRLPTGLPEGPPLKTRELFEACLGKCFPIEAVEDSRVELLVGHLLGEADYMHSIYVEPDCLELVSSSTTS
jgi:hypothetical protein